MTTRKNFEKRMRDELEQLKAEYEEIKSRAGKLESSLEAEYLTRTEELKLAILDAERKFELFVETHDEQWETFKTDLEKSWESLRELIRAITAP